MNTDLATNEKKLLSNFRSLNSKKKKELFVFLNALTEKRHQKRKKVTWEDITGVVNHKSDASADHDKYLKGSL